MSTTFWFFGFLIAAATGTIATAATVTELKKEAASWADGTRWAAGEKKEASIWTKALGALLGLLTIEILFACAVVWFTVFVIAILNSQQHRYVFGSLVGGAAAPWLWLHFTRSFGPSRVREETEVTDKSAEVRVPSKVQPIASADDTNATPAPAPGQSPAADEGTVPQLVWVASPLTGPAAPAESDLASEEKESSDQTVEFARYRFMTYILAAAVLINFLQPYLDGWFKRVQKFGAAGVEVQLAPLRSDRGTLLQSVAGTGQSNEAKDTAGRLSSATLRAYQTGNGLLNGRETTKLANVKSDMAGFGRLSLVDRDKVYIAYLLRERDASRGANLSGSSITNPLTETYLDLSWYVRILHSRYHASSDETLLKFFANISRCVSFYAEQLRDFRLFLVNSEDLIRPLLFDVASQWSENGRSAPHKLRLRGGRLGLLLGRMEEGLKGRGHPESASCAEAIKDVDAIEELDVSGVGLTPYPADFIANYLAAIDSVESGVIVMTDWLQNQRATHRDSVFRSDPEYGWYAVRGMLTASQLPYKFGGIAPTHRAQVQFQEQTTNRMAELLGLAGARSWRSLCNRLRVPGLHALVGRHIAFTYADERNYLFELLVPEDLGIPRSDVALKSTDTSVLTFLDEAEAIIERPDCFEGVNRFAESGGLLIAAYHLNAAYLQFWIRMTSEGDEKTRLTRQIRDHLNRAKSLGDDKNDRNSLDLLRRGDEFERHRARLARLAKVLDNEEDKE